jgi:hypothetical protein
MRVLLVLAAFAGAAGTVTAKNWEHHPTVEASRSVYTDVKTALDAKSLLAREKPDCTEEFSTFFVATNGDGVVRYLRREFGGDDSSHVYEQFYDAKGRVRFVLAKVGAVPQSWVDARYWIDESGTIAWRTRKSGGEGPTYYLYEPEEVIVRDPKALLAKHTRCP